MCSSWMNPEKGLELYLHIPFCVRKCGYCDFLSFQAETGVRTRYLAALAQEIRCAGRFLTRCMRRETAGLQAADGGHGTGCADRVIGTVFIGGGTPSLLTADEITALLREVRTQLPVAEDAEVTIEVNPGTVDAEKLAAYRAAGINRLSIGCQSMQDEELARMGRIHDRAAFLCSYGLARAAGFTNVSFDLISGLPGQSPKSWRETLRMAAELAPEHISAYGLILEEGTPFYRMRDALDLPDEDAERRMYEATAELLAGYGYAQYEISNYAKPGFACRHNIGYWTGVPYLGLGLGAASYLPADWLSGEHRIASSDRRREASGRELSDGAACPRGRTSSGVEQKPYRMVRCSGVRELAQYLRSYEEPAVSAEWPAHALSADAEWLTEADLRAEYMILGLRMNAGIRETAFAARFSRSVDEAYGDVLRKYKAAGLLARRDGRICLTERGRSLANVVMAEFL